jgi:hypothetical protein
MLKRNGLTLQDFDIYEIHEAFAAQVLCTLRAWESEEYCKNRLGLDAPMGRIDRARINPNGSSLAAGHPFAATGARIVATAAKELKQRGGGRCWCRSAPPAAWAWCDPGAVVRPADAQRRALALLVCGEVAGRQLKPALRPPVRSAAQSAARRARRVSSTTASSKILWRRSRPGSSCVASPREARKALR